MTTEGIDPWMEELKRMPPKPSDDPAYDSRRKMEPPIAGDGLFVTIAWDTWWPDSYECLIFESRIAADEDAKRLDPGWRAVVCPVTIGPPVHTEDGETCAPYDDDEDDEADNALARGGAR